MKAMVWFKAELNVLHKLSSIRALGVLSPSGEFELHKDPPNTIEPNPLYDIQQDKEPDLALPIDSMDSTVELIKDTQQPVITEPNTYLPTELSLQDLFSEKEDESGDTVDYQHYCVGTSAS